MNYKPYSEEKSPVEVKLQLAHSPVFLGESHLYFLLSAHHFFQKNVVGST